MLTPRPKVLIVDDESAVRAVLADVLGDGDEQSCATCASGSEALQRLRRESFDVVLADVCMPGMGGLELLDAIVRREPHPSVIVMTGRGRAGTASQAQQRGAFGLIEKPLDLAELRWMIERAVVPATPSPASHAPVRSPSEELQQTVWKFTPELTADADPSLSETVGPDERRVKQLYVESIRALVGAVEAKDPHTEKHSVIVSYYGDIIARRMGLSREQVETIKTAAILHDIGKIGIPDAILQKPGPLTAAEFEVVKWHPVRAVQILGHASFLRNELPLILHHHERYDGRGYPDGLSGNAIPIGARILAAADAIETMLARRAYKPSGDIAYVRHELMVGAGGQFDPAVAAVATAWLDESPGAVVVHPTEAGSP